jgi:hypothetical protein
MLPDCPPVRFFGPRLKSSSRVIGCVNNATWLGYAPGTCRVAGYETFDDWTYCIVTVCYKPNGHTNHVASSNGRIKLAAAYHEANFLELMPGMRPLTDAESARIWRENSSIPKNHAPAPDKGRSYRIHG